MYSVFHTTTIEYTVFSVAHGTFFKIEHMLANKACLPKCRRMEIISCIVKDLQQSNYKLLANSPQKLGKHMEI